MAQEDGSMVNNLRKEVEKAWSMVESAKVKEDTLKKHVTELKAELSHLQQLVNQGTGLPVGADS